MADAPERPPASADNPTTNFARAPDRSSIEQLVEELRSEHEDTARRAVSALMDIDSSESVRALVYQWAAWIALDTHSPLVEHAAQYLRTAPEAVLPVLDLFETGIPFDVEQIDQLLKSVNQASATLSAK